MIATDKPIVIRMSGGLANRMFQYTYALYLEKLGYKVYVDNNYKATKWKMEDVSWEKIFPHAKLKEASSSLIFRYGGGYDFLSKVRRHYIPFLNSVYQVPSAFYCPDEHLFHRYHYIIGVYQNAPMADKVTNEAKACFEFSEFTDERNINLKKQMTAENSVAIHVRKGKDYLTRPDFKGTCDIEYYKSAIDYVKQHVANPKFYVFTDNPSWVKENLTFFDYQLVEGNPPVGWGNHFDMQLMSCCKHNIIANSTYSWWGAYLNNNPDKIVIGPKQWFSVEKMQKYHLKDETLCKDWIAL